MKESHSCELLLPYSGAGVIYHVLVAGVMSPCLMFQVHGTSNAMRGYLGCKMETFRFLPMKMSIYFGYS